MIIYKGIAIFYRKRDDLRFFSLIPIICLYNGVRRVIVVYSDNKVDAVRLKER